jgi:hypothetical protein
VVDITRTAVCYLTTWLSTRTFDLGRIGLVSDFDDENGRLITVAVRHVAHSAKVPENPSAGKITGGLLYQGGK